MTSRPIANANTAASLSHDQRHPGADEPQRPRDVGDRRELLGGLPAAPDELERAGREHRADDDPGHAEPAGDRGALDQRDAGQRRPGAREQGSEVLADGDAEVAMEGLEDDID